MNRSIPIIAFQLNALKIENKIILNFTTVLDIYEEPEDEEKLGGEEVGRPYWEKKAHAKSIKIMDDMIAMAEEAYPNSKVTYNKHHIALGTTRQNYMWFHPRKSPNNCHLEIKVGKEYIEEAKSMFEELGISYTPRKDDRLAVSLQSDELKKNSEKIMELIKQSIQLYS